MPSISSEISSVKKILLLGTGYTLSKVAQLFNKEIVVLTTTSIEKKERFLKLGFTSEILDINNTESIINLFSKYNNIEVIVDSIPPILKDEDLSFGVQNIAFSIKILKNLRKIIYLSTTGVFGVRDGSFVDENTPSNPLENRSKARLASEDKYSILPNLNKKLNVYILRIPAIYGDDRGLFQSLKSGTFSFVKTKNNEFRWSNRIHVEDLALIIYKIINANFINTEKTASSINFKNVYCVGDDEPALQNEVVQYYCNLLGIKLPPSISEEEAIKKGHFTMLSNQRILNTLLKHTFDVKLKFPNYKSVCFL